LPRCCNSGARLAIDGGGVEDMQVLDRPEVYELANPVREADNTFG
jgi:hypothetical protein